MAMSADPLTTAVAANINAECTAAISLGEAGNATAIARKVWPELTAKAAGIKLARIRKGKQLRLCHIGPLAAALGVSCDDLTSTETTAAREALGADHG